MENNQQTGPEQGSLRITWVDCCSLAGDATEGISLSVKAEPSERGVLSKSGLLYLIADGLGNAGIGAARYVLDRVVAEYYRQDNVLPSERLRIIFRSIGTQLFSRAEKEGTRITPVDLTAAVIFNGEIIVANAGGNRAYLIHDEQVQLITHDPTRLNEILRKGNFTVEEAQNASRQRKFFKRLGEQPESDVDIIQFIPVVPGDMLLLCNQYLAQRIDEEDPSLLEGCSDPDEICTALTSGWDFSDNQQNIILLGLKFEEEPPEILEDERFGDFIPIGVPPVQTHYRPAPAYTQKPIRVRGSSRFSAWFYFLILMCVLGIGLLGVLALNGFKKDAETRLGLAQTAVISSPAVEATRLAASLITITPITTAPAQPSATSAVSAVPTAERTAPGQLAQSGNACVWEIQKGNSLYSTIRKFDLAYNESETYYYFTTCDLTKAACTGEKLEIESHSRIDGGWFVIIPVADQAACSAGEGKWVEVTANPE